MDYMLIAKINALHQYYVNVYKEDTTYDILPQLAQKIVSLEDDIDINDKNDVFFAQSLILSTYNMFLIEKFDDSSRPYSQSLSDIESEIDHWLENQKNESVWKQTKALSEKLDYPQNNPTSDYSVILEPRLISIMFTHINMANTSTDDSFFTLLKVFRRMTYTFKVPIENFMQFIFVDNYESFIGENKDSVKLRKYNTLLKHALDSKNYKFLRGAIFIRDFNGKKICNPLIDFNRVEIIDGKEETLIDFFDKVIEHPGSDAVHSLDAVRDIENDIIGCIHDQNYYETHEIQNLSESELREIRLQYIRFYNDDKYSRFGYYSRKDKKEKYGFINKNGDFLIPLEYEDIGYSIEEEGLIQVSKNGKLGYIDIDNKIIIPISFDKIDWRGFENGKRFTIDKTGKCIENCD